MSEENPYSAPMASFNPETLPGGNNKGIWRDGKKLVVHRQAVLPEICVKTNEPSQRRVKRKYYWHHPAAYLAILVNILVYVILALVIRKTHKLEIPISEETGSKRWNRIAIGWVTTLAAIALFVGSIIWMLHPRNEANAGFGFIGIALAGIMLITGGMIGLRAAGILYPQKMTASATWFKGAHLEYLERFPQIPSNL